MKVARGDTGDSPDSGREQGESEAGRSGARPRCDLSPLAITLALVLVPTGCGGGDGHGDGGEAGLPDAAFDAGPPECVTDDDCVEGGPNTQHLCYFSSCRYPCLEDYQECDGDISNGCEVSVVDDPLNCGYCNNACYWGACAERQCEDPRVTTAGAAHTCALTGSTGGVLCWGRNADGELGDGTTEDRLSPTRVPDLTGMGLLAAGDHHTCAAPVDGTSGVYCWGDNSLGQLGSEAGPDSPSPVLVPGVGAPTFLAAGGAHTCAVVDRHLLCWGDNSQGQLGVGDTAVHDGPVEPSLPGDVENVALGGSHTCVTVQPDRQVLCWGDNRIGQLGDGTTTRRELPTPVPSLTDVYRLAAGGSHTCAAGRTGLVCWGENGSGQLGDGTATARRSPVMVRDLTGVNDIELGAEHTCARDGRGRLYCWGRNDDGQLGDGTTDVHRTPTPVDLLARLNSYAAGGAHTCADIVWGEVRCWGANESGQLGDGTTEPHATPATVPPP